MPRGVAAHLACPHPERCEKRNGQRLGPGHRAGRGCPLRPRCRWRISWEPGVSLVPYKLLVSLVVNTRVEGKVRQGHIADFGAIDGHLLPDFYSAVDASIAEEIRNYVLSIAVRLQFWHDLDSRLLRLSNRIDANEAARIRAAIHDRIPKPTAEQFEKMEITGWQQLLDAWQGLVDDEHKKIVHREAEIAEAREAIASAHPVIGGLKDYLKVLPGNPAAIEEAADERHQMDEQMLRILAIRAFGSNRVPPLKRDE